ncbi:MAG: hypothetical protein QNK30_01490 [Bacteroidales bacterium]|nr:hypothetical protein [Bacteroidales bacterium]
MAELTKNEKEKLWDLYMSSHEFVWYNLDDKRDVFYIKKMLSPDNLIKEFLENEFNLLRNNLARVNPIFHDHIIKHLEDWKKDIEVEDLVKNFMQNFACGEYFEEYINYDYSTIDMYTEEKDVNLPHFQEMISVITNLEYFINLTEWYNQELKNGFKNKTDYVLKGKLVRFTSRLKIDQYKYLYKELAQTHEYINENKTSETDFLNVFTKKFDEHDSKIYFLEETTQIAYLFHLLRKHFTYLFKCIGDSEKFISRNDTIFKSNNISSQLSKTVKEGISVKNSYVIDEIINNIP